MKSGLVPDGSRSRSVATRIATVATRETAAGLYFLALGVACFLPTFDGGFILQLDMVFAPETSYLSFLLAEKGPLYYGRIPFLLLLDLVTAVVPDWIVQRALLVVAVSGAGTAAYRVTDDLGFGARLFAGTLYAVNPFTYVRLLAGQWYFVLGYAALPLAVVSFYEYVSGATERPYRAAGWATVVAIFDPHAAVLLAFAGVAVLGFVAVDDGSRSHRRTVRYGVLAVAVNAYWLLPAVASVGAGDSQLAAIDGADLTVFSPDAPVAGNVLLSVSMLYGFWRGGYALPVDLAPPALVGVLFVGFLFLAVLGWLESEDALGSGLALVAGVGAVLAVGASTDLTSPVARELVRTPVGAGMRDTGKFVALLALAYAVLGGRGVDATIDDARRPLATVASTAFVRFPFPRRDVRRIASILRRDVRQIASILLAVAVILAPLAYTFPMVLGFWGGFATTDYPADWHAVDDRFDRDDGEYRVLVLPWHQYVRFDWTDRTVANPAPLFFGSRVVSSRDPGVGVGSQATDPTHRRVRAILAADDHDRFGQSVAPLGVKYVVLLKAADYQRYEYLDEQPDLSVVSETDGLVVYRNDAYDETPAAGTSPRDGPSVPLTALAVGSLASLAAVGVAARSQFT